MLEGAHGTEASLPTPEETARFKAAFAAHLATLPPLLEALTLDARSFAVHRFKPWPESRWRRLLIGVQLCWSSDDFLGVVLYRLRTTLRGLGVPLLPTILHRICIICFGIRIGDPVVIQLGMYLPHGNVVIDGFVAIGRDCVLCPWITVGLLSGKLTGPNLGDAVFVGTGAKIIGPVTIGGHARIGAGSVVVRDVPAGAAVSGVPARPTSEAAADEPR